MTVVYRVLGERPKTIPLTAQLLAQLDVHPTDALRFALPDEWLVYNAPRPLLGNATWMGEFIHGLFYAAIDPSDEFAATIIQRDEELDAWRIEWLDRDATLAAYAEELEAQYSMTHVELLDALMDGGERALEDSWRQKHQIVVQE